MWLRAQMLERKGLHFNPCYAVYASNVTYTSYESSVCLIFLIYKMGVMLFISQLLGELNLFSYVKYLE